MSRARSSELVVVAARAGEYAGVRDVLQDWSALGLVSEVTLVNTDAVRPDDVRIPCTTLTQGEVRAGVLQEVLASRTRTDAARVVVVSSLGAQVSSVTDQLALSLVSQVTNALPTVSVLRAHLIGVTLPQGGALPPAGSLAWLGWHNVLVSPENAQSPTSGVSPIVEEPSDPTGLLQLAGCLCSVAGLWADEPTGALDQLPVAPGETFMLGRSFSRHLSAGSVEAGLIVKLADMSTGYPVPLLDGSSAEIIDDEVGAVTAMAQSLEAKHKHVFAGVRAEPRPVARKVITVGELLKMFFAFLGQALRNAPRAFVDRMIYNVSRTTAAAVNRTVFGSTDPAFRVVVNGIGPDGKPATWDEFESALAQVDARAEGRPDTVQHAPADLAALWHDFVDGALTLIDAGSRSAELAPQMKGSRRAIVVSPGRIAPDPAAAFAVSGEVAPYVNRATVDANDVMASREVYRQLDGVGQRAPHLTGNAAKVKQELQEFFGDRERTYSGRFGFRLFEDLDRCRNELLDYDRQLARLQQETEANDEIYERQRKLARQIKVVLAVALLLGIGTIALGVLGVIAVVIAVAIAVVVLLAWFGTSLWLFFKGQTMLFALLNQRQRAGDLEAALRQNAAAAREDLRRLGRAYRQYLDWSRALGVFAAAPLGQPQATSTSQVLLGSQLPRNHRFGVAAADPQVVDRSVSRIRRDLFAIGWASEAWNAFLADLPDMGPDGFRVADNREVLYADPAITQVSLLTAWSSAVVGRRWDGATRTLRDNVAHLLRTTARDVLAGVLEQVRTRDESGAVRMTTLQDFVGGLDTDPAGQAAHLFQRTMFSASAASSQPWTVAHNVHRMAADDFGRTIVLTQLSRGFSSFDLQGSPAAAGAPAEADPWNTIPERPSM